MVALVMAKATDGQLPLSGVWWELSSFLAYSPSFSVANVDMVKSVEEWDSGEGVATIGPNLMTFRSQC